ncbi:MAG TPA: PqqD family protein [Lentimicrobium sp.]|nr:PqqD family protein [Lentimicrobium sp.]
MRVNPNIAISESGFLFNPSTGESFKVNGIGGRILGYLKEGMIDEEIIRQLTEEFEVDEKELSRDMLDFNILLKQYHLIENND